MKLILKSRPYASLNSIRLCSAAAATPQHSSPVPPEPGDSLHRRISPHVDPTVSISPVLDRWLEEAKKVEMKELHGIINGLRRDGRFKHALEVSEWMSDKLNYNLSKGDVAVKFDLISKVHGPEQAEEYFNNIKGQYNHIEAYANRFNSYAREKSVEKAEILMNKLRDSGLCKTTICYNAMINLYIRIDNQKKVEALIHEMEYRDIKRDKITFCLLLGMYTDTYNIEGIERVLEKMDFGPKVALDWHVYSVAANGFIKAGLFEKAFLVLKKSEGLVKAKQQTDAFYTLVKQYASIGKKDEVLLLWELLEKQGNKLEKSSYMVMITSLLKLDDLEKAEMVFDKWESSGLPYNMEIPDLLIGGYGKKGLVEKAEALVEKAKMEGGIPSSSTYYYLAAGYLVKKEMEKALGAMKMALSISKHGWRPNIGSLVACLKHLIEKGDDFEEAKEFLELLLERDAIGTETYRRLSDCMKESDVASV